MDAGDFRLLDASDRQVYSFVRALSSKDGQVAKRLLVMVNVSGEIARIPSETAALLPLDVDESHIVITTHDSAHTKLSLTKRELAPCLACNVSLIISGQMAGKIPFPSTRHSPSGKRYQ